MASEFPQGKHYSNSHLGQTVFVCGSAPCLPDEYKEARKHRPDALVIGVNEAVSFVRADFLVSYHAEKFDEFKSKSLNPEITTHTGKGYREQKEESQIDYRWDGIKIGATSAGDAVQIARQMGFSEIIMIGCPMNGGDGYFKETTEDEGCPRFGFNNNEMVKSHKETLRAISNTVNLSMVRSMSGFSSEIFGKPKWG